MTTTVGLPAKATLVLGLVAGVAQTLAYLLIPANTALHSAIAVALYLLLVAGIPPLLGPAFAAALHLPPKVSYVITVVAAGLVVVAGQVSGAPHVVLIDIITVVGALGFAPSPLVVTGAPDRPTEAPV